MSVVVSVADIVHEMVETDVEHSTFLNRTTGELYTLSEEQRAIMENGHPGDDLTDWERQVCDSAHRGELVELPSKFEHQEYSIVERFCYSVQDPRHRDQLLKAIRGKRAFRDFNSIIGKLGRKQEWCDFRDRAFEAIAVSWLEKHQIPHDHKSAA